MNYFPESWPALRRGIWQWAETNGQVGAQWGRQAAPTLIKPFISLTLVAPPRKEGWASRYNGGYAFKIASFLPNTLYRIRTNGVNADYTTGASGTVQEIRDALLSVVAGITADYVYPWATDTISMVTTSLDHSVQGPILQRTLDHFLGEGVITVAVDCFAPGRTFSGSAQAPGLDALEIQGRLLTSFDNPNVIEFLREQGWAFVSVSGERDMSMFIGGQWESRAGFDLRLRCRTRYSADFDFIEYFDRTSIEGTVEV